MSEAGVLGVEAEACICGASLGEPSFGHELVLFGKGAVVEVGEVEFAEVAVAEAKGECGTVHFSRAGV